MVVKKSGNLLVAWWNIIICGALIVGSVSAAMTTGPFGLFVAVLGLVMEVIFIRMLLQIRRERREDAASAVQEDS